MHSWGLPETKNRLSRELNFTPGPILDLIATHPEGTLNGWIGHRSFGDSPSTAETNKAMGSKDLQGGNYWKASSHYCSYGDAEKD